VKLERVKAIYDEISKYEIKLEADPRSLGPLYLQNVISEGRNYLNLVSRVQLEVHREKQDLARQLRAAEVAYEIALNEILSNDERVRHLPSIKDREATANTMLREQLNTIAGFKSEVLDLEYVEKAIRHRHRELTATMSEIKLQRSLIRDEIDSGAMYGDERRADHEREPGKAAHALGDIDEAELDALMNAEQDAAKPEPEPEAKPPAAEEAPTAPKEIDEEAVKAFLEADPPAKPAESEDYAEVFDRL